jgi:predicted ATPase
MGEHRLKDLSRPEHVFQLLHPDLDADFPPLKSLNHLPNNLPLQVTSFVSRDKDVAELKRLLDATRVLTLTGAGGSGKTRLSLHLAAEVLENYPDGVWCAELAPLEQPDLMPHAVAAILGVRAESGAAIITTLVNAIGPKKLLLVLDNCEHLIDACARLVEALTRSCPNVRVLATSREPLRIPAETTWRVPLLEVPDPEHLPPLDVLASYESVRLFLDRALAAQPRFALTRQNARAVAQICSTLDGIPLAIELAAARVKVLSVEQIATRLDDRFRLLTVGSRTALPRQQTLRALVDWSHELLSDAERMLLRRLAVFAGGWTLDAAETVCAVALTGDRGVDARLQPALLQSDEVLDWLAALVDKSLVLMEEHPNGGGGLNVEINYLCKLTSPCFKRGKISRLSRHLHF